jgi:hypothetical protein
MPDGPTTAHRHEESRDSRRKDAPSLQIEAEDAEAVIVWAGESELASRAVDGPLATGRVHAPRLPSQDNLECCCSQVHSRRPMKFARLTRRHSPIGTFAAVTRSPRFRKSLALMDSMTRCERSFR